MLAVGRYRFRRLHTVDRPKPNKRAKNNRFVFEFKSTFCTLENFIRAFGESLPRGTRVLMFFVVVVFTAKRLYAHNDVICKTLPRGGCRVPRRVEGQKRSSSKKNRSDQNLYDGMCRTRRCTFLGFLIDFHTDATNAPSDRHRWKTKKKHTVSHEYEFTDFPRLGSVHGSIPPEIIPYPGRLGPQFAATPSRRTRRAALHHGPGGGSFSSVPCPRVAGGHGIKNEPYPHAPFCFYGW